MDGLGLAFDCGCGCGFGRIVWLRRSLRYHPRANSRSVPAPHQVQPRPRDWYSPSAISTDTSAPTSTGSHRPASTGSQLRSRSNIPDGVDPAAPGSPTRLAAASGRVFPDDDGRIAGVTVRRHLEVQRRRLVLEHAPGAV